MLSPFKLFWLESNLLSFELLKYSVISINPPVCLVLSPLYSALSTLLSCGKSICRNCPLLLSLPYQLPSRVSGSWQVLNIYIILHLIELNSNEIYLHSQPKWWFLLSWKLWVNTYDLPYEIGLYVIKSSCLGSYKIRILPLPLKLLE